LELSQVLATAEVMGGFWGLRKKKWLKWLALAFFVWPIMRVARVSVIEGEYLAGIIVDGFRFVGVGVKNGIRLINQDLESGVVMAFLKFSLDNYWPEAVVKFFVGIMCMGLVSRLPKKLRMIMMGIVGMLVLMELWWVMTADPIVVI